ncbi:MAG: L-fuculose phosphate aldolase [Firmicutes bacterium ADurb.Bin080]|nr:hypothetical protein [Clostridiales bacterium]OQC12336.1 MAG: L-fuculose phosphate aldolase [Firmicutes bacterium ADurb.Bin080]
MIEKVKRKIIEIGKLLGKEDLTKKGDTISVRVGDSILLTDPSIPLPELTDKDFKRVSQGDNMSPTETLHMAILGYKKEGNAVIVNQAPYCSIVTGKMDKLPAVLDDFAQIVGYSAKVSKSDNVIDILTALKKRNACLIQNGSSLAVGRTLEEAFTGVMVLEKGAKAFVESTIIGNPVKIGLMDALLMNFIYKKKYSKKNQENLLDQIKKTEE